MEIDRNYSRPLDVHRWSNHPEVKAISEYLWHSYFIKEFPESGRGNRELTPKKNQFKVLLYDLYVAWLEDPKLSIGIGMSKRSFNAKSRYNALHISFKIVEIVKIAERLGFLEIKKGSEISGKITRILPTPKLQKYFDSTKISLFYFQHHKNRETILLNKKNKAGKSMPIEYDDKDFADIPKMRNELEAYNSLLSQSFIDIPTLEYPVIQSEKNKHSKIYLMQNNKFVRRIFYRGDWKLGSRFHGGWWQQLPKEIRGDIYINDQSTIEQDYSGLHLNLLYGLQKRNPLKDPYSIDPILNLEPIEQRKIVKSLILLSINASSVKMAFKAFRNIQEKNSKAIHLTDDQLMLVLNEFNKKHPFISKYLCADKGVSLMNIDGKITAKVINHFTNKRIPVLSIHDSYIVPNNLSGELRKVMNKAVREALGGFEINIDQEGIGFDQIQSFRNMDRANIGSYEFGALKNLDRTNGYMERKFEHDKWIKTIIE